MVQLELSRGASGGVTCPGGPAGSQLGLGPLPSLTQTLFTDSQAPQAASLDWHTAPSPPPPPLRLQKKLWNSAVMASQRLFSIAIMP